MAKTKISEFSATPANNTDIDSINIAEGCAPSGINDAIRELMAQLKDFQTGAVGDSFNGPVGTSTAAAGAFTTLSSTGNTTLGDASGDAVTVNGTATFANANPTLTAGTANGVTYLNGSKVLTSGTALVFDGTNLGIGTSSVANTLHVVKAKVGTGAESFDLLRLNTSGTAAIGDSSNIIWTNGTGSTVVAKISGTLGGDATAYGTLAFSIRNYNTDTVTEVININNRGNTKFNYNIGIGGATPSTSGTGITFPATQSASSDANTLDDYEEGTFTPTIVGTTTAGTGTYTGGQTGRYTKIGNRVYVNIYLGWSAHTGTGNMRVDGLPFTSINASNTYSSFSPYMSALTLTAGNVLQAYVGPNKTSITLEQVQASTATSAVPIDISAEVIFGGFYEV